MLYAPAVLSQYDKLEMTSLCLRGKSKPIGFHKYFKYIMMSLL